MKNKKSLLAGCALMGTLVVDSFLIDPFLLILFGIFITLIVANIKNDGRRRVWTWGLGIFTLLIFWAISISLYLDLHWIDWLWRLCGAVSGKDWMLNSGVFNFNYRNPSLMTNLMSGAMFAIYPLWLITGIKAGIILFGAKKTQEGLIGLFK